jgi:uncharacterized protein
MPAEIKTPGIYIQEKNAFPDSVVEVATSVPAFVGYTQSAERNGETLINKPWRITSLAEFHNYFGFGPLAAGVVSFSLSERPPSVPAESPHPLAGRDAAPLTLRGANYMLTQTAGFYLLYSCLQHFFQNGGAACYVVSVGSYDSAAGFHVAKENLIAGIRELAREQEPAMLVVPDAVLLDNDGCIDVQQEALDHCGDVMKNRVAILDIWEGYRDRNVAPDCVSEFRNAIGSNFLSYGAAYYPWLNTTIVQSDELTFANIDSASRDVLIQGIKDELAGTNLPAAKLSAALTAADQIKQIGAEDREQAMLLTSL